jgi:anaerobic glycerol-3-phosphate dehydrogenase B subunit
MMMDEGAKIIPHFKQFRILRAWAGVRPLIQETSSAKDREISREFVLLDHADRDGVDGIVTITSGKWTTYRKMAQVTVDKICEKLRVDRPCRTHLEILPSPHNKTTTHHYLGTRLATIEEQSAYGQLICECELASEHDIEQAIIHSNATTLDDIRRLTRLGMGPCQGAFCTFRAAGMLHALKHPPVSETNVSLRDFLQERWKGNLPILRGQQLRQARFNELIYVDALNATNLPGERVSDLASEEYIKPIEENQYKPPNNDAQIIELISPSQIYPQDIIVIGAGIAGLITAWRAGLQGRKINIITKGWGATYWNTGCIDLFGYQPPDYLKMVDSPKGFLENFINSNPEHPYALAGLSALENAVQSFLKLCQDSNYPYHGSLDTNILLPTSLGTLRPSCLIPETMIAGNTAERSPMLIVGFSLFLDFFPALIADNLNAQNILARELILDLPSLRNRKFITGMVLARLFEDPEFRQEVIDALTPNLGNAGRIGFPAVLGLQNSVNVMKHLQSSLGIPVFEIPGLPPSIPGIRLHNILVSAIERNHGTLNNGMLVSRVSSEDKLIQTIWSEAASRWKPHHAYKYVLATGGILGGGITADSNGYAQELIFNLPVNPPEQPSQWLRNEFLSNEGHPINRAGVHVDQTFHPVDKINERLFQNLYVVGGTLGNCDPLRERSLEGIALATGYVVGDAIAGIEIV